MVVFPPIITSEDVMELPLTPWLPVPKPQLVEGFLRKIIGQILTKVLLVLSIHLLRTFLYKVIIKLGRGCGMVEYFMLWFGLIKQTREKVR